MGLNKVFITGNLGADPEMRFTPNGQPVVNMRVAVNRRFYDSDHQLVKETEWFGVVVWGKKAESCNQYLAKGSSVFVEGRLQTREWEDKDGQPRHKTEIVATQVEFLSHKSSGGSEEIDASGEPDVVAENIDNATRRPQTKANSKRKVVDKK